MNATLFKKDTAKKERHIVHIINPVSGSGIKFRKARNRISELGEDIYLTTKKGDCAQFIAELLVKDPHAHIVAHGGDGTMQEAADGIMTSGASSSALFTGIPSGSGNDFLRYMYEENNDVGTVYPTDLICANGKYSINICNMGFDCTVVSEAEKIRRIPGLGGGISYIGGVVSTLFKKEGFKTEITCGDVVLTQGDVQREKRIKDEFLLVAIANGKYYGGGFKAAPSADSGDGLLDVVVVKNISIPTFISLVGDFKKGTYIDPVSGRVKDKFKEFLSLVKCRSVSLDGIKEISYDGEIVKASSVCAEVIPGAILYTPPKKEWLL